MATQGKHGQSDQRLGVPEPERDPGQQPDLGVDRLDQPVGQPVIQGRVDGLPASRRFWPRRRTAGSDSARPTSAIDPTPVCPARRRPEHRPQTLLEQIGPIQYGSALAIHSSLARCWSVRSSGLRHNAVPGGWSSGRSGPADPPGGRRAGPICPPRGPAVPGPPPASGPGRWWPT